MNAASIQLGLTTPDGREARRWPLAGWAVLPLALLLAYSPGIRNDFVVWDDDIYIRDNPNLRSIDGLIRTWLPIDVVRKFYPLTFTTHWVEHQLWGDWAGGYYAVNVLLHAANALLVLRVALMLGLAQPAALLAAAIFALHPMQAASVAWLASRKNVLSTLFALIGFLSYLLWRRDARPALYRWAMFAFLAAMLSKSAAVTMLGSTLVADAVLCRRRGWSLVQPLAILLVIGAVLIRIDSQFEAQGVYVGAAALPLRPVVAATAFWFYLGKFLWPAHLATVYPQWTPAMALPWLLAPIAVLLAAAVLFTSAWTVSRRARAKTTPPGGEQKSQVSDSNAPARTPDSTLTPRLRPGAAALWCAAHYAITMLPVLGLLNFGYLRHAPVGDQYVYLAAIAPAILVALAAQSLAKLTFGTPPAHGLAARVPGALVTLICVGAVGALAWFTYQRVPTWRGEIEFWSRTVADNPAYDFGHRRLGEAYLGHKKFAEAVAEYQALLKRTPDDPVYHNNLGAALLSLNRAAEAETHFRAALAARPVYPNAQLNFARVLSAGALDAEEQRQQARLRDNPHDRSALTQLAAIHLVKGRKSSALDAVKRAVEAHPDDAEVRFAYGFVHELASEPRAALDAYREAVRLARANRQPEFAHEIEIQAGGVKP
ncbi:MAG: tetratricopeptide repeat protein [Phycisphaerae bacterium]